MRRKRLTKVIDVKEVTVKLWKYSELQMAYKYLSFTELKEAIF